MRTAYRFLGGAAPGMRGVDCYARRVTARQWLVIVAIAVIGAAVWLWRGADPEKAMDLWEALYPSVDYPAIVETIANKVFGMRLDQVAPVVDGPLCCHGLGDIHAISCRSTQPRTTPRIWSETWSDVAGAPRALCRNKWN
jgi:hypothetical protein